jgi:tetratricopeptide (TPR) repeat protein
VSHNAQQTRRPATARARVRVRTRLLVCAAVLAAGLAPAAGALQSRVERAAELVQTLRSAPDDEARRELMGLGAEALAPLGRAIAQTDDPVAWTRLVEVYELALRARLQELEVQLEDMPEPGETGPQLAEIQEALQGVRGEIDAAGYASARELARPGGARDRLTSLARNELLRDQAERLRAERGRAAGSGAEALDELTGRMVNLGPLAAPLLDALLDGQPAAADRAFAETARDRACARYASMLSADDDAVRRFGAEALFGMGDLARPLLERLAAGEDADLRERASLLLRRVEWRISQELYRRTGHLMPGFEQRPWRDRRYEVYLLEKQGGAAAVPTLRRVLERDPSRGVQLMAAEALARLGDPEGFSFLARAGLEPLLQAPEMKAQIAMDQGIRYLQIGRYDRAIEEFETVLKIQERNHIALYNLACAYSLKGEAERACGYLEASVEAGFDDVAHIERDPDLDPIREHPRYRGLVERMRMEQEAREAEDQ